ncbi:hypothetical protein C8R45DRAFT_1218230 [Mycena sanguinolenta]|nr:hypothetical protein C8R45DRAFT_1218230 [Mycena sanguinolenta]
MGAGATDGAIGEQIRECIKVEWCKAYVRVKRSREEVLLLQEEMVRCLRTLEWQARIWDERAAAAHYRGKIAYSKAHLQGATVFAARQAAIVGSHAPASSESSGVEEYDDLGCGDDQGSEGSEAEGRPEPASEGEGTAAVGAAIADSEGEPQDEDEDEEGVSSEVLDPIMGDGVGYFCRRHGEDGYYVHVLKHADKMEVSNGSGFQAMSLANTKRTKGLRSTGVAGVTCSRPNMWRANGVGDLQVGEHQCNVNFVLLTALISLKLLWLMISYDIACQFAINFWSRMMQVPTEMQLMIKQKDVWWKVKDWRDWVDRWEAVQHMTPEDSLFDLKDEVRTLRDIQLQIATEEFVCTGDRVEVEWEHTPGGFIRMGLEIEDTRHKLTVDVGALKEPTATQKLNFTRHRTALLKWIHKFRQIQRIYMPSVFDGNGEQLPEATRLFMLSELAHSAIRKRVCTLGLPELEARMRDGEATEALEAVRTSLRTCTKTNHYKLWNYMGQGLMTRGQGILRQINIRIHIAKLRYQYSRAALLTLHGHGTWEKRLRVLADDDVRALNECALTDEEKAQNEHWAQIGSAFIEGGIAGAAGVAQGKGTHTLSWIWYSVALRVEWCKALGRTRRYTEEVRLLREEMRRMIACGRTAAAEWEKLAVEELPEASPELMEGRRANAAEQAATERARCTDLEQHWQAILVRVDTYLDGETGEASERVEVEVEVADELDPEEEKARLEAEEEG